MNAHDEALTNLRSTVSNDLGTVVPFSIPDFKIGSLDALIKYADDLTRLCTICEGTVTKVGEALRSILDNDPVKLARHKLINDKSIDVYLRSFRWNKVKYRTDRPMNEILDTLQKEIYSIDTDVKNKFNAYNQVKTSLTALFRKQSGDLSTKSLLTIVDPKSLITDSEYLESHLVAVPKQQAKDFLRTYETLSPMVVPRSAQLIVEDEAFQLYSTSIFKKYGKEFTHKCREKKWFPRDFDRNEKSKEAEVQALEAAQKEERKVWGEALRLGRTAWGEAAMAWCHVLSLRVFVETVLRYGLPLSYVCGLVMTSQKLSKRVRTSLDANYSYLGGNAFGRDKKGRITKDDSSMSADMQASGHIGDGEYTAFVFYEFQML